MILENRIEHIDEKRLIGTHVRLSLYNNQTENLWRGFMLRRKEIEGVNLVPLYSLQVYDRIDYFEHFNPKTEFSKYALVEANQLTEVPLGMEEFILPEGDYAVFMHTGTDAESSFRYIFEDWFPKSNYELDHRPHFELLGEKFVHNDAHSEEEIWIPIKQKRST